MKYKICKSGTLTQLQLASVTITLCHVMVCRGGARNSVPLCLLLDYWRGGGGESAWQVAGGGKG